MESPINPHHKLYKLSPDAKRATALQRFGEKVVERYVNLPRSIRKPLWRLWHLLIIVWGSYTSLKFMNYGYADLDGTGLDLKPEDESERYGAQLYHVAASHTELAGKDVLEVSSGRGGGASYIARYLKPRRYVGVDLSEANIRYCNRYYRNVPGLHFVRGDAEHLPFDDNSFDALVNVEASRAYGRLERFFSEVRRVVKPGGSFLLTDMRWREQVTPLRKLLTALGFTFERERDILPQVVRALTIDHERRIEFAKRKVPKTFFYAFAEFAGTQGSERYESFRSGRMQYFSWHLRVPT